MASIRIDFDLETTANGGPKGDDPGAEWPNNKALCVAWVKQNCLYSTVDIDVFIKELNELLSTYDQVELRAHNIMFDLKWLIREGLNLSLAVERLIVNCTMVCEYLNSGYKNKFVNLEELCDKENVKYRKALDLGALLKAGMKMEEIPIDDLVKYCREDVKALRQLVWYDWDMQYLIPLAHMELNGLPIDKEKCEAKLNENQQIMDDIWGAWKGWMQDELRWDDGTILEDKDFVKKIKPLANRTVSYLLTGEPKAGLKVGTKYIKFCPNSGPFMSSADINAIWGNCTPTHLGYPVSNEYLEQAVALRYNEAEDVLLYRKAEKLANTYFGPWLETAKHSATGNTIHPSYNPTATNTGRLSSSNPNGQNIPPAAKEVITSGRKKRLTELDFKQLEMHAVAALSEDEQLIVDLNNGVDIHFETGKSVMGWRTPSDMNEQDRRTVKGVNFGLLYGGGPGTISAQTGAPKKMVRELIDAFYERYPGVAKWHEEFYHMVVDNMMPSGFEGGEQIYESTVESRDRYYYFIEKPSPDWLRRKHGRSYSFKPTETKNYPVQGFAGAQIVMHALWTMYKEAVRIKADIEFHATVHDSILFSSNASDNIHTMLKIYFCNEVQSHFNLPTTLTVDEKSGKYWQEEK